MTPLERKQAQYEGIIDEVVYIARASDGSLSPEWIMQQPIFIRKRYLEKLQEEQKRITQQSSNNSKK